MSPHHNRQWILYRWWLSTVEGGRCHIDSKGVGVLVGWKAAHEVDDGPVGIGEDCHVDSIEINLFFLTSAPPKWVW